MACVFWMSLLGISQLSVAYSWTKCGFCWLLRMFTVDCPIGCVHGFSALLAFQPPTPLPQENGQPAGHVFYSLAIRCQMKQTGDNKYPRMIAISRGLSFASRSVPSFSLLILILLLFSCSRLKQVACFFPVCRRYCRFGWIKTG